MGAGHVLMDPEEQRLSSAKKTPSQKTKTTKHILQKNTAQSLILDFLVSGLGIFCLGYPDLNPDEPHNNTKHTTTHAKHKTTKLAICHPAHPDSDPDTKRK